MAKGDIPKAVKFYREYLQSLATFYGATEKSLQPKHFDDNPHSLTEMLLVSHVYWDLARCFDLTNQHRAESQKYLDQFVLFSSGYKYQHVNAQMVKKFIRRRKAHNLASFEEAYNKIYVKPKGCYVASLCFDTDHPLVNDLRTFRGIISKYDMGKSFIDQYYRFSPTLVDYLNHRPLLRTLFTFTTRPLLRTFVFAIKKVFLRVHY